MAEMKMNSTERRMTIRHRGRGAQVMIYLGKMLRMFVYQNDWKVLPMAALIAGLVGMVIRTRLFKTMEGTLMGAFAMVMVCIWNGCFNSIQVICRERDVIKREHRSGMHISSYIISHMLYQGLLCLAQTIVTLYITRLVGVQYPAKGLFTPWLIVDFGISMFLITYASDMLSLWVSCLSRSTTTAMTIMPFVLIFQLVFSGGLLALPAWTEPLTHFTISNPALKVLAAQSDYNARPVMTVWNTVNGMRDKEVSATVKLSQVFDLLTDEDNPTVAELRNTQVSRVFTLGEVKQTLDASETFQAFRQQHVPENVTLRDVLTYIDTSEDLKDLRDSSFDIPGFTVGGLVKSLLAAEESQQLLDQLVTREVTVGEALEDLGIDGLLTENADVQLGTDATLGELVDLLSENPDVKAHMEDSYTFKNTVGDLINLAGEDRVADILQNKIAEASQIADYDNTQENILHYWFRLFIFVLAFAALSTITLEFIDKDKR